MRKIVQLFHRIYLASIFLSFLKLTAIVDYFRRIKNVDKVTFEQIWRHILHSTFKLLKKLRLVDAGK